MIVPSSKPRCASRNSRTQPSCRPSECIRRARVFAQLAARARRTGATARPRQAAARRPARRRADELRAGSLGRSGSRRRREPRSRRRADDGAPRRDRARSGRRARRLRRTSGGRRPKPAHDPTIGTARARWRLPARMRRMPPSAVGSAARSSSRRAPSNLRALGSTRTCAASCVRSFRFKPPIVAA